MKLGISARDRLIAGAMFLASSVSIWCVAKWCMAGPHFSFAGLWPAGGFLVACLFYVRPNVRWAVLAAAGPIQFLLLLSAGLKAQYALLHTGWDLAEAAAAASLIRVALGPRALLRSPAGFLRLQLLVVFPSCLTASIGFWFSHQLLGLPGVWNMQQSVLAHMLGMGAVLPAMLLLAQPALPALRRSWRETAAILGGVALILFLMLHRAGPPALVLTPALLFATFRLGPRGAAGSTMLLSLIAMPVVASGAGPFSIHPEWTFEQRVSLFQVAVLSLMAGVTLMAFMLAQQARLNQLLKVRAQAARAARRRAIEASQAKTQFLATMSHEVRTPMNSILGFTALLERERSLSPKAQASVEMISKAGVSLMALLNDILDFSKVEAGQVDLEIGRVDVVGACREVLQIVGPTAEAKGLTISFGASADAEGAFQADALRLRQILFNLMNNAVKFTADGAVNLTVGLVGAQPGNDVLRFEVNDTGIGIAPEVMPRLFARFFQADSTVSRRYGGTGLGLAICKGLVERMGGRIGVDSKPGEGSTFWFEIPLTRSSADENHLRADAAIERVPLNARVLLVDDHPVNRQLGQALLEMLGCRVGLAEDGEQAVEAASKGGYDVILMDVHMPRMDGLAATRAILQLGGPASQTPIIALSADVLPQNIALCLKAGMVDHVPKPVQLDTLYLVMHRHLRAAAALQAVVSAA